MDRKMALVASATAAVVLVAAGVMVAALARQSAGPPASTAEVAAPEVGTTSSIEPKVVYQDEYEYVPVAGTSAPAPALEAASPVPDGAPTQDPGAAASAAVPSPSEAAATSSPPVVVTAPTPTTTSAPTPTTTTARPPGVPSDWPADKPIPPMPAGCRQPQLEDDGVWNCQH